MEVIFRVNLCDSIMYKDTFPKVVITPFAEFSLPLFPYRQAY